MKLLNAMALVLAGSLSSYGLAGTVDLGKSQVAWVGKKVVGSSHDGNVKIQSAEVVYKDSEPQTAKVVIDMTSITNNDVTDPQFNQKLVGHLKSDDFFGVEKHKTSTLAVKKIEKVNDKLYQLHGDLTIKGKALPIKLKAEVTSDTKTAQVVKVDFTFDRAKYDVRYGSGTFFSNLGDKMISDDIDISVTLHINKDKKMASN